jgi:hypothetical protein
MLTPRLLHSSHKLVAMLVAASVSAAITATSVDALACGGCFAPPAVVQNVNAHRMALAVSPQRTTLWDQFQYSGNPSEFSWILPIRNGPEVRVELASNDFLQSLETFTAPQMLPPPPPQQRFCPLGERGAPSAAFTDAGFAGDASSVIVHREEVVGPYALVILGSDDADALRAWLRDNGFSVPPAIEPIIDHYVAQRMDFIALKLRPGQGIQRMSPVRVSMPGYAPTLPLRMVSAGVSDKVGLTLFVIGASRFEAANFPNAVVQDSELTFDYRVANWADTNFHRDTLVQAFAAARSRTGPQTWLTETALRMDRWTFENAVFSNWLNGRPGVQRWDAGVAPPEDGGAPLPTPREDVNVALTGMGNTLFVTRLTADIPASMLDRDLQLVASASNTERSGSYRYGRLLNVPPPPPPCPNNPSMNPVVGGAQPLRCSVGNIGLAALSPSAVALSLTALAAVMRRRTRRTRVSDARGA